MGYYYLGGKFLPWVRINHIAAGVIIFWWESLLRSWDNYLVVGMIPLEWELLPIGGNTYLGGGNATMGMRAVAGIGRSSKSQQMPMRTRTYIHLDKHFYFKDEKFNEVII